MISRLWFNLPQGACGPGRSREIDENLVSFSARPRYPRCHVQPTVQNAVERRSGVEYLTLRASRGASL